MSQDNSGWRRERDRAAREDDRDWHRRGRANWGRGGGWDRDDQRDRFGNQEYDREAGRDDWRRGPPEDRLHGQQEDRGRTWDRPSDRFRDRPGHYGWGGGYGRDAWGRDDRRDYGFRRGGPWSQGLWEGPSDPGFREEYGRDPGWDRGMSRERDWEPGRSPRGERSWWNRASDEVSSWFGDRDAERRRREDDWREMHRGRGPRGYTRSDERIREDVSDRLTDNPILDATEIEVVVAAGEVTLTGHVDSRYSKRLAEDIVEDVSGVRNVQNNLRVRDTQPRDSISGTSSGISEGGLTSDLGRVSGSGVSGSSGTGDASGAMTRGTSAGTTSGDTSGNATSRTGGNVAR